MANMSHCRFENTFKDLADCDDHFDDDLSPDETKYRKRLIELCKRIYDNYGDEEEGFEGDEECNPEPMENK